MNKPLKIFESKKKIDVRSKMKLKAIYLFFLLIPFGFSEIVIRSELTHREAKSVRKAYLLKIDQIHQRFSSNSYSHSDGHVFPYRLYIPENAKEPLPLVFVMSDAGGIGTDNKKQITANRAAHVFSEPDFQKKHPSYLLAVQIPKMRKGKIEEVPDVFYSIIAEVEKKHAIDPKRRYYTGQSMGALFMWYVVRARPDFFAGVVSLSGYNRSKGVSGMENVPIWIFHGERDPVIPTLAVKKNFKRLSLVNKNAKLFLYPKVGHPVWDLAYEDGRIGDWLFSQSLP